MGALLHSSKSMNKLLKTCLTLFLLVSIILFGLYSDLPDAAVQILGAMPFLFMIFFSTTFSPGAGVRGLKELRYLFSRYYLWCMLPEDIGMEGCPEENNL